MADLHKIKTLILCLVFGTGSLILLFSLADNKNRKRNDFTRIVPPLSLRYKRDIKLPFKNYYFAGQSGVSIFLGNNEAPNKIIQLDTSLTSLRILTLAVSGVDSLYSPQASVNVSGHAFLTDGVQSMILQTILPDSGLKRASIDNVYFTKALPVSEDQLIIMVYDTLLQQNIFRRYNLGTHQFYDSVFAPVKMGDGIFSIDGMLDYNPEMNRLVYVYFFRNRFDYLDMNLHILFTGHTIDTTENPAFNISHFGNHSTLTSRPVLVNRACCISGQRLYIHSGLIAKNENYDLLSDCSIIDVYSLITGRYIQSLYAYNFRNKRLDGFKVIGNDFIGLFGNYLAKFTIKRVRSDSP